MSNGNPTARALRTAATLVGLIDDLDGAVHLYATADEYGIKIQVADNNLEGFRAALGSLGWAPTDAFQLDKALHIHSHSRFDGQAVNLYAPLYGTEAVAARSWLAERGISPTVTARTAAAA